MTLRAKGRRFLRSIGGFRTSVSNCDKSGRAKVTRAARAAIEALERRVFLSVSPELSVDTSSITEGDTVTLSLNSHEDGADGETVVGWRVQWSDGTDDTLVDGDVSTLTHTYANDGSFAINTWVTTSAPGSDVFYTNGPTIAVTDPLYSPTVSVESDTGSPTAWAAFDLDVGVTYSGSDTETHTTDHYSVNWGDGVTQDYSPTGDPEHLYAAAGTYSVSASITDEVGTTAFCSPISVSVGAAVDNAPTVTLSSGNTTAPAVGWPVTVNGLATYWAHDPDSDTVDHFTLNWDDGSGPEDFPTSANSGSFTHVYTSAGTYNITATATDGDSQTSATSSALSMTIAQAIPEGPGGNSDGNGADLFVGSLTLPAWRALPPAHSVWASTPVHRGRTTIRRSWPAESTAI
jgi:PKD repeat protein